MTLGLLAAELGRACSSLRSLLTVHTMVAHAVARWGTRAQKDTWLPRLARGERIGALAVSEPGTGSDASSVTTRITPDGDDWILDGHKKWITYGESADLFLVVGRSEQGPTALLVERDTPGLRTELIEDMIGIRASMTANVYFDHCRVPGANLLARPGLGVSHVTGAALDLGRYTVGWGCVGILDACLEAATDYAADRVQFGVPIREHQLVRRMITDMYTSSRAARLLCLEAGGCATHATPGRSPPPRRPSTSPPLPPPAPPPTPCRSTAPTAAAPTTPYSGSSATPRSWRSSRAAPSSTRWASPSTPSRSAPCSAAPPRRRPWK